MRVILCLHHHLDPDLGAPGVTLRLGRALEDAGCTVEHLSFDDVFGAAGVESVRRQAAFPWKAAPHLRRRAARVDVVDAATGDAWLWASLGRPGAGERTALVTRSHGLETLAHAARRRAAVAGQLRLSRRYRVYHGGWRLREVRRSLRLADGCVLLNRGERDHVHGELGVPAERLSVIQHGIGDHFHAAAEAGPVTGPLRVAYVGSWIPRKGAETIAEAAGALARRGVDYTLKLLGVGDAGPVRSGLSEAAQPRVDIVEHFANERLPELLAGEEILLLPSWFEGSSGSLLEGMACGLAPVATPVGSAPDIVEPGHNGLLVTTGDADGLADALAGLARDRPGLFELRRRAQTTARAYRWDRVAELTIQAYERALTARSTASTKRGPTRSQT